MSEKTSNTVTMPGKSISIKAGAIAQQGATNLTVGAVVTDFESVKHLLSTKPLRAPRKAARSKS
jgi:hypothetical protein